MTALDEEIMRMYIERLVTVDDAMFVCYAIIFPLLFQSITNLLLRSHKTFQRNLISRETITHNEYAYVIMLMLYTIYTCIIMERVPVVLVTIIALGHLHLAYKNAISHITNFEFLFLYTLNITAGILKSDVIYGSLSSEIMVLCVTRVSVLVYLYDTYLTSNLDRFGR